MIESEQEQFEHEQLLGNRAQRSYDEFIKPFIEQKRLVLFDAFRQLSLSDETNIMEVKRMLSAVDALETEILTVIETGKLASESLTQNEGIH